MLASGKDTALLRYSIGNEYAKAGDWAAAADALSYAVALDPTYTAAWKLYAKTLEQAGRHGKRSMRIDAASSSQNRRATARRRRK